MNRRKIGFSIVLLTLFFSILNLPYSHRLAMPIVQATSLPADGDAWTENDNATYIWTCSLTYPDEIEFSTVDKKVGSYSLKVNHTSATTYMGFVLDLGSAMDFSNQDIFVFWFKIVSKLTYTTINMGPNKWSGPYRRVKSYALNHSWDKAVMPLDAFTDVTSPSWTNIRYIHITIGSLSVSDETTVYIDGMYFTSWSDISESANVDESILPNFYSFIHRWQKTQTYQNVDYTSLYSMIPLSGSTFSYEGLESETLSQTIYGLLLAYQYSDVQYFLDSVSPYVTWLLQFQYLNETSSGHGGFRQTYNGVTFNDVISPRNGWILGALSLYYRYTSDVSVRNAIDLLRGFIINTLWDDSNEWFDYGFNIASQTVADETKWSGMNQGCYSIGLSLYYKYVSQNATVKDCVDLQLNKGLGLSQNHEFYKGAYAQFEDSTYAWTGYY